jgi:PAS domain S-box-containing protein
MEAMSSIDIEETQRLLHTSAWLGEFITAVENLPIGVTLAKKGDFTMAKNDIALERSRATTEETTEVNLNEDFGFKFCYANKEFCKMSGYSRSEVVGQSASFLQCEETELKKVESLRSALQDNSRIRVTLTNKRKNGELFSNHLTIKLVHEDDSSVCYGICLHLGMHDYGSDPEEFAEAKVFNDEILKRLPSFIEFDEELHEGSSGVGTSGSQSRSRSWTQ